MVKHPFITHNKFKIVLFSLCFLFTNHIFSQPSGTELSEVGKKGEELFKANCAACHNMTARLTGPALHNVAQRRSEEWLLKWIKNNVKLRESGDKDAIAIYNEYNGAAMTVFENLSDDEIKSIITYTSEWTPVKKEIKDPSEEKPSFYSNSTLWFVLGGIIVLLILASILALNKRKLATSLSESLPNEVKEVSEFAKKVGYWKKRINPTIFKLGVGTFILLILGAYGYKFGVTKVAVQQGYAPEQPIHYSHKLHAGEYKIDCKYCHTTVEKSAKASIPSLNTCMNCHKGVQARDKYDGNISPEILKIYKALDFNHETGVYGNNPKPIRWVRIHNLPDHAFFNHSHHVKTAGVQCQECHGPIQEMEVVQQYSTLQMGWCIDCHRNRNVDVENNPYYEKLHEKIKAEKDNKNSVYSKYYVNGKVNITAAQNGALECSKCHY